MDGPTGRGGKRWCWLPIRPKTPRTNPLETLQGRGVHTPGWAEKIWRMIQDVRSVRLRAGLARPGLARGVSRRCESARSFDHV